MFTSAELLARFTLRWMDAENLEVTNHLSDKMMNALVDQTIADFDVFKLTCDNTSKETQLESINKYFKGKFNA